MNMDCTTDKNTAASSNEGKRLLRTLELKAFRSVVDAIRAQGSFTSQKCSVLKNLAFTLKVGDERCRSEMRRAVNDNLLNYIARCSEQNSEENWRLESARKVARMPMVNEPTVFTTLADKVSDWVSSHNRNLVEHDFTLMDILESKKSRTDANACRFHTTKLCEPFLSTSSRNSENIAIELEKIKFNSKMSSRKIQFLKKDCSPVPKPTKKPLLLETSTIIDTPAENTLIKVHSEDETDHNDISVNSVPAKDVIEVKNKVPSKPRPKRSRSKSRQKRSQSVKTNSLQEELSRTVSAVNALVAPITEPSTTTGKRQCDDSFNDEWHPKEKKAKTDSSKKVPSTVVVDVKLSSDVSIDEIKSVTVSESEEKDSAISNTHSTDESKVDDSQQAVPSSVNSSVQFAPENQAVPLEKDFTPHTFNLIPASRRLKMVKKKENSNGSLIVKELEPVISANNPERKSTSTPSLTIIKSSLPEKKRSVDQNKDIIITQMNNSSSSVVIKCGKLAPNEPPLERRKGIDEKLKNVLPMLSHENNTLSLLGNIKVRNLNAKAEDESLEGSLSSCKNKAEEMEFENEDEFVESWLDTSEVDSGSNVDSSENSTFDDSDSHSVIEYWDHEDDEDIVENGNNPECDLEDFQEDDSYKEEKVTDDEIVGSHQDVSSDEASGNSDFSDEIVEEIVEDEEFYGSDIAESYESDDAEKLILDFKESESGEEHCDETKLTVSAEKPTNRELESIITASSASVDKPLVIHSSTPIQNSSTSNVISSQKNDERMGTSSSPTAESSACGSAVSILKLRKPVVVGTTAELSKAKEVVIVSPKSQKTVSVHLNSEKSPSESPKYQMIPPSKCIVRGQTISLANARLIGTSPKTSQSAVMTSAATADLPKITFYSSAKISNSGGNLPASSSASKNVTLLQNVKTTSASIPVKQTSFQPSTLPIPKKVCRLYELIDIPASDSPFSNSSHAKKNLPNKKPAVSSS